MKDSFEKLIFLLNSNNEKYMKMGIYALRKFFVEKVKSNNAIDENGNIDINKNTFYLDDFINNKIFEKLFNIINNNRKDFINCYEIFWILLDSSIFPSRIGNNFYDYHFIFFTQENIDLYNFLVINNETPKEIVLLLIKFLSNLCLYNENIRLLLLKNNLVSNSFSRIKNTNGIINYEILYEFYHLFSIIAKNFNNFDFDSSKIFFHIFSSPMDISNEEGIQIYCLYGLEKLSRIKDENIIKLFTESKVIIDNYKNLIKPPLKEELIFYSLKILSNLLLNTSSINVKNFIQKIDILNIYLYLIDPSVINLFLEKINIQSEIIIGFGNLCLIEPNYGIYLTNYDNIYHLLLKVLEDTSFNNKIYSLKTFYNAFKIENINISEEKILLLLKKLIFMMNIESNKKLLIEVLDVTLILISILINYNDSDIEKVRFILNNFGFEDIIQRKEIFECLNEEQYQLFNLFINK